VANKQPFYHRVTVLFTATRALKEDELKDLLFDGLNEMSKGKIVKGSVEIEEFDEPEPGDPADLM
jgi:hypothetical protein